MVRRAPLASTAAAATPAARARPQSTVIKGAASVAAAGSDGSAAPARPRAQSTSAPRVTASPVVERKGSGNALATARAVCDGRYVLGECLGRGNFGKGARPLSRNCVPPRYSHSSRQ